MAAVPSREARPLVTFTDDHDRYLPEGPRPLVLDGHDALAWVNIQTAPDATAGSVHVRFWDTGKRRSWLLTHRPGFLFPTDRPGVLFVGMEKELGTLDLATGKWHRLATIPDANPRTVINDGEPTPDGRAVVFGTKDTKFADPIAELYLFTLDDNVVSLLAGRQTCSNGKVFAHYGSDLVLFDIDTPTRRVTRYRLDLGRRVAADDGVAVDVSGYPGFPDGMRDAGDGTAIVAFYNPDPVPAGRAIRFDLATGQAVEEWAVPGSPRVTCPCLVPRPDGVKLVLTTATEGMPADQRARCPEAGNLFVADTDLPVCPPPGVVRFSGPAG